MDLTERIRETLEQHEVNTRAGVFLPPWAAFEWLSMQFREWYGTALDSDPAAIADGEHEIAAQVGSLAVLRYALANHGQRDIVTSNYEAALAMGLIKPDWRGYVSRLCQAVHDSRDADATEGERQEAEARLWVLKVIADRHMELEERGKDITECVTANSPAVAAEFLTQ